MAGQRFIDLVSDLETISTVNNQRTLARRLINNATAAVCSRWDWPWLWTESFITTVAEYTTGTVDVTNGSTAVTGNSTTFTSGMVGRKFQVDGDTAIYTIASFSSTTSITLDQAYQGDTASASDYSIFRDTYRLRADADHHKLIRQAENGIALIPADVSSFDVSNPMPSEKGNADIAVYIGRDDSTYSTGTVSMSTGGRTLTGSSTAWTGVQGLGKGNKVRIGTQVFTVNTVDSDTQITTYEAASSDISSGTSYVAILDNPLIQLYTAPDTAENYFYRFQRTPAVMDRDGDIPDVPHALHPLILRWALAWMHEHHGQYDKAQVTRKFYEADMAIAISRYGRMGLDKRYRRETNEISQRRSEFARLDARFQSS